jgi:putative FmdB family regulatory protein
MPLYEFECRACAHRFETLVRGSDVPTCPGCGADDLERALSTFAVGGAGRSEALPAGACGRCGDPRGPGACSLD